MPFEYQLPCASAQRIASMAETGGLFVAGRILFRRGAAGGDDLLERALGGGFPDAGAGDQEEPVIAVVEVEKHPFSRAEHVSQLGFLHARVVGVLSQVGEEGVALLAAIRVVEVVAELNTASGVQTSARKLRSELRREFEHSKAWSKWNPTVLMMNAANW